MLTSFQNAVTITPHDVNLLAKRVLQLHAGTAGTITVLTTKDQVVTFTVPAGGILPITVKRVNATGTTSTGIVGLY